MCAEDVPLKRFEVEDGQTAPRFDRETRAVRRDLRIASEATQRGLLRAAAVDHLSVEIQHPDLGLLPIRRHGYAKGNIAFGEFPNRIRIRTVEGTRVFHGDDGNSIWDLDFFSPTGVLVNEGDQTGTGEQPYYLRFVLVPTPV
jgi:hypothetical protein